MHHDPIPRIIRRFLILTHGTLPQVAFPIAAIIAPILYHVGVAVSLPHGPILRRLRTRVSVKDFLILLITHGTLPQVAFPIAIIIAPILYYHMVSRLHAFVSSNISYITSVLLASAKCAMKIAVVELTLTVDMSRFESFFLRSSFLVPSTDPSNLRHTRMYFHFGTRRKTVDNLSLMIIKLGAAPLLTRRLPEKETGPRRAPINKGYLQTEEIETSPRILLTQSSLEI